MNFDRGAVAIRAGRSRQSLFRGRGIRRLPAGPIRRHGDEAHVTRIGVDNIGDAPRILPCRPVSKALRPRYEPPHTHKLLGNVVLGLRVGGWAQQAECQEPRNRDRLFHRFCLSPDVCFRAAKNSAGLRGPDSACILRPLTREILSEMAHSGAPLGRITLSLLKWTSPLVTDGSLL